MKLIIAIVQPFMAPDVDRALHAAEGVTGATYTDVRGFGRARRGGASTGDAVSDEVSKVRIEVVVRDERASDVAQVIRDAAHTGNRGDGKVFVLAVERAMRIASDEEGERVV